MNENDTVVEVIQRVFEEELHIEVPDPDTDLLAEGLLDSFVLIHLIASLETELGVTLELDDLDPDLGQLKTVRTLAAYLQTLRGRRDVQVG